MFDVEFEVPVPVERAWAFVVDGYVANHHRWDPGVLATETLADGPMRPGLRGRERRRFFGEQITTFEVSDVVPGELLRLRDDPATWELTRTYTFADTPHGCRLTFTFDMTPRRPWFRLLYPAVRHLIERQVRANMRRLASLLATEAATGPAGIGNGRS